MNKSFKIAIAVIVGLCLLVAAKDWVIKSAICTGARAVLGAPVSISQFSAGLFNSKVKIINLKVFNPPGFPKDPLIDAPLIAVKYELGDILKGHIHLSEVIIDLKQVTVIKNKDGKLNVDSLKIVQKEKEKSQAEKSGPLVTPKFLIDRLSLNVGRVVFIDGSSPGNSLTQVFDVHIKNRIYKNISSPEQLVALVLTESMKPTAIKGAAIYGVAALAGVAFLPAGIAAALVGKDSARGDFNVTFDDAYAKTLSLLKDIGHVASDDKSQGLIKLDSQSNSITVKITSQGASAVQIRVTARKFLLPQPQVASGILYQIAEKLK